MTGRERAAGVLREARTYINPDQLCRASWAKTEDGKDISLSYAEATKYGAFSDRVHYVEANSPQATQWCAEGAVYHAAKGNGGFRVAEIALRALRKVIQEKEPRYAKDDNPVISLSDGNAKQRRQRIRRHMTTAAGRLEREARA